MINPQIALRIYSQAPVRCRLPRKFLAQICLQIAKCLPIGPHSLRYRGKLGLSRRFVPQDTFPRRAGGGVTPFGIGHPDNLAHDMRLPGNRAKLNPALSVGPHWPGPGFQLLFQSKKIGQGEVARNLGQAESQPAGVIQSQDWDTLILKVSWSVRFFSYFLVSSSSLSACTTLSIPTSFLTGPM